MVEMEYLDPAEGWVQLHSYEGDTDALEAALLGALAGLQQCLGGSAVHGDLRRQNIVVRQAAAGSCVAAHGKYIIENSTMHLCRGAPQGGPHRQLLGA